MHVQYMSMQAGRRIQRRPKTILDEVQPQPELFPLLRVLADRRPLPSRFLIPGSASVKGVSESTAGGFQSMSTDSIWRKCARNRCDGFGGAVDSPWLFLQSPMRSAAVGRGGHPNATGARS